MRKILILFICVLGFISCDNDTDMYHYNENYCSICKDIVQHHINISNLDSIITSYDYHNNPMYFYDDSIVVKQYYNLNDLNYCKYCDKNVDHYFLTKNGWQYISDTVFHNPIAFKLYFAFTLKIK